MSKRRRGGGYVDMEESKDGDERDFKIEADWKEQSQEQCSGSGSDNGCGLWNNVFPADTFVAGTGRILGVGGCNPHPHLPKSREMPRLSHISSLPILGTCTHLCLPQYLVTPPTYSNSHSPHLISPPLSSHSLCRSLFRAMQLSLSPSIQA